MNENYDVYKFAIHELDNELDSIIECQKGLIKYHQDIIDSIKEDGSLGPKERDTKIEEYLRSISLAHNLLRENNIIINSINAQIDKLKENVFQISQAGNEEIPVKEKKSLEEVTKNLKKVMTDSCAKIYKISEESKELLIEKKDYTESKNKIEEICRKLYRLTDEVNGMLEGINFNEKDDEEVSEVKEIIASLVKEEQERADNISNEAYRIIGMSGEELFDAEYANTFYDFLRTEYSKILDKITDLDTTMTEIQRKEPSKTERVSMGLIQEVVEDVSHKLMIAIEKIEELVEPKEEVVQKPQVVNNEELTRVIDNETKRITEYGAKVNQVLQNLKDGKYTNEEIVAQLSELYKTEMNKMGEATEVAEQTLFIHTIDEKQKEEETQEYKKYCSILNKSFWEARQKASSENIKYPSALYERMVKEYQNEYLITNFNVSLEEVEESIELYREKYAEDLYMDDIYEQALYAIREETSASIQEICDESCGLSLLDKKAYNLLEDDFEKIIKEIALAKQEEDMDESLAINQYRKSFKLSKLITKKEMVERQMYLIRRRASRLERSTY